MTRAEFVRDVLEHEGPFWLAFLVLVPLLGGVAFLLWVVGR